MTAIEALRALIAFDTTSRNSNLALIHWAVDWLSAAGARIRVTHDDTRGKANVLASFGPDVPGGIVLSAHTDVVPVDGQSWTSDPFELTERDGRFYGRGTSDMKGFIACCLAAAPGWAADRLARPIHLALSYDEEVGCLGVSRLVDDLRVNVPLPALAIVGEPTGMRIADRHRGYLGFETKFQGRAAHSSDPWKGASAISAAARFVSSLDELQARYAEDANQTTFNVGMINGGTNINIIPGCCALRWEVRPAADANVARLRRMVCELVDQAAPPDLPADTREIITVPPLWPAPIDETMDIARHLGVTLPFAKLPFGTEGGFFQEAGIPTVICGPGSIEQAHQADEWIAAEQLEAASRLLARVTGWVESQPRTQQC